ncbi:MAG TPA: SMP-30/gluconolactonase/LRE family protein [Gemmatimonadaceae bacterium]|nr:SMP-30/gluconolactonase/LRE family protein [Gemmatimonadaceae bacterium]
MPRLPLRFPLGLTPRQRSLAEVLVLMLPLVPLGCVESAAPRIGPDSANAAEDVQMGVSSSEARFVRTIVGFQGPESVRYDADQDVYFVSNMAGAGSARDGNGYISRVSASNLDSATVFAQGGKNGVTLDAPKGLAIHGDTLWATDITVLRGFDRHTGKPIATIDFAPLGAVQLNDIAVGPDSALHVTDTGIIMSPKGVIHTGPDRIFVVGPSRQITVAAEGFQLGRPNGITWDDVGKRWIVVSFDQFSGQIMVNPSGSAKPQLIRTRSGGGQLDGVEVLNDGAVLFSSWADSSIHLLANGRDRPIIREVAVPADIGVDTKRNNLAIPLSMLGHVQVWSLDRVGRPQKP